MFKQTIKKSLGLALKIFLISSLIFANLQLVMAGSTTDNTSSGSTKAPATGNASQDCAAPDSSDGKTLDRSQYSSFNVKCLSAQGQNQKYLAAGNPIAAFILQIINLLCLVAASLAFFMIVLGGFLMVSSTGNEAQLNKGREVMTRAVVGLVLTLSAYYIVSTVQNVFFESAPK